MGRTIETTDNTVLTFIATQNGYDLWSEKNYDGECTGLRVSSLLAATDEEILAVYRKMK